MKDRYMAGLFRENLQGAAHQGVDIIYLSSDEVEELGDLSITPVLDLQLSSEYEENDDVNMLIAQCVEMELSTPIPIPGPSTIPKNRNDTPKWSNEMRDS